ncbi:MAG: hypothetical protein JWO78_1640, partial [Micavibrio sp.]|nr:hypothetical protein [Micavibrio sp.]
MGDFLTAAGKVAEKFNNVMDAPENWAEKKAYEGISTQSAVLIRRYDELSQVKTGDGVGACLTKTMVKKAFNLNAGCDPDHAEMARDVGGAVGIRMVGRVITGVPLAIAGTALGMVQAGAKIGNNHLAVIRMMAEKGEPGYAFSEIALDDVRHQVYVDASSEGSAGDGKIQVIKKLEGGGGSSMSDMQASIDNKWDRAKIAAQVNQETSKALGGVHDYVAQHGQEAYKEHLNGLPDKMASYMGKE